MPEALVRISAPHFCAGFVAVDGRVTEAAPILRYMVGWSGVEVVMYCRRKGWDWERVWTKGMGR